MMKKFLPIILITAIAIGIWGWLHFRPNTYLSSQTSVSNPSIIYADAQYDPTAQYDQLAKVDFYSVSPDGTGKKELFSIGADKLAVKDVNDFNFGQEKFCSATNEIYLQSLELPLSLSPIFSIKRIDLGGTITDMPFTQTPVPFAGLSPLNTGFALSPDCKKIIWATAYFPMVGQQPLVPFYEIYTADIDGKNKTTLATVQETPGNTIKKIYAWSKKYPSMVYMTDYAWDKNGGGGGLYKLDATRGKIQQINQVPADALVYDISDDENKIAYAPNFITTKGGDTSVRNLIDSSVVTFSNDSNGKRLFSPLGDKLANVLPVCSGLGAESECIPHLFVYIGKQNKEIAETLDPLIWLSESSILAVENGTTSTIVAINDKSGEIKNIATTNDNLIFIGIKK